MFRLNTAKTRVLCAATAYCFGGWNRAFCDKEFAEFRNDAQAKAGVHTYSTRIHEDLFNVLQQQKINLIGNRFVGTNGSHCCLIHGPKDIGMTTVLSTFLAAETTDLFAVYLNYDELYTPGNSLNANSILEIVKRMLEECGIVANRNPANNLGVDLVKALETHNKHVFVVVDAIDQLYRVGSTQPERTVAMRVLGDLAWLGNQRSGRFAVVLCGSSTSTPLLLSCRANRTDFPLQIGAPDLDEQRYRALRLTAHCTRWR